MFRTQVNENRAGPVPTWKSGFRNNRGIQAQNKKLFPDLFQSRPGAVTNQQGNILSSFICISVETKFIVHNVFDKRQSHLFFILGEAESQIEMISKDLKNYDPEFVLKQVIPDIVSEGQNKMKNKEISVEQFSAMMKSVFQLKEQVMMQQAEKRHNNQQMINPWQDGAIPGENASLKQQPFNVISDQMNPLSSNINIHVENIENSLSFSADGEPKQSPLFSGDQRFTETGGINQNMSSSSIGMANRDLPLANDADLAAALADPVKRIEIDQYPRDIRFYGETALIIMGPEAKDMRELRFKNEFGTSSHRRIIIDQKFIIPVEIASPGYKEFRLDDGVTHTIKIGAPTRELWIDGQWHELYFNKSGKLEIGSSVHDVFLEGPSPTVDIGNFKQVGS